MASNGVNKVFLVGNLGADPDVRSTQAGDLVANLRLATSESWKDKTTGEPQERTEWHRVVVFGKLAEIAQQYLRKGSKVYIEGQLRTRKYQAQDGSERWTTEIHLPPYAGQMQMLDSPPSNAQDGWGVQPQQSASAWEGRSAQTGNPGVQQPPANRTGGMESPPAAPSTGGADPQDPFDDDIPF